MSRRLALVAIVLAAGCGGGQSAARIVPASSAQIGANGCAVRQLATGGVRVACPAGRSAWITFARAGRSWPIGSRVVASGSYKVQAFRLSGRRVSVFNVAMARGDVRGIELP